jgi:Mlc titration factor MtfA (ptsG expression regulator)
MYRESKDDEWCRIGCFSRHVGSNVLDLIMDTFFKAIASYDETRQAYIARFASFYRLEPVERVKRAEHTHLR